MPTQKRTVSVRLDAGAARRLDRAADLMKQSRGAFLEKAGDETARRILLEWAVSCYRRGERGFSELADETGLAVEEIMEALGRRDRQAALTMFLASCRTIAESENNPEILRLGQEAVDRLRDSSPED